MSEDNKVSEFKPRRTTKVDNVPPNTMGSGLGDFERERCGECWHFKREPRAGLGVGRCMLMPPLAFPVSQDGQPGQALVRPVLSASYEGCDQFDDSPEEDEEDDGEDGPPPAAASKIVGV